jgi:hypothetical protein
MSQDAHRGASFSVIAHSVGAYAAYGAIKDHRFPSDSLKNFFSLAAPLYESPLRLQIVGMDSFLDDLLKLDYGKLTHVAHFNINGGPRDLSVPTKTASF